MKHIISILLLVSSLNAADLFCRCGETVTFHAPTVGNWWTATWPTVLLGTGDSWQTDPITEPTSILWLGPDRAETFTVRPRPLMTYTRGRMLIEYCPTSLVVVETSDDLRHWRVNTLGITAENGRMSVPFSGARFYRVRVGTAADAN